MLFVIFKFIFPTYKQFNMKKILAFGFLALFLMYSCKDDDATPDPQQQQALCDSINVDYENNIRPILQTNCATPYCHEGGAGGITLNTYNQVKEVAEGGKFLKAIKHQTGASPMPKTGDKLSDTEIEAIECWIQNGYKEKF
jgi:mono/diheme cytochrome c family protein